MSYPPPPAGEGDEPGYGEQQPGYGMPGPGYGYPAQPKNNTKALMSLIFGIASIPLAGCCSIFGLIGIAGIVLGNGARKEIAASQGAETGEGMAKAGFICGIVGTALAVVTTIVSIVLVATGHSAFYVRSS